MDKRYLVEEVKAYGPDDAGWEPQDSFDNRRKALLDAADRVKPTPHGDSGVRVFDTVAKKVIWDNTESLSGAITASVECRNKV